MAKIFLSIIFFAYCGICNSQNTAIEQYNQFKQQAHKEYSDFRKKCNAEYAEFLKQAWESYQAGPVIPKPKDETVPPVVIPEEDIDKPVEPKPVPIDNVVAPIIEEPKPQPLPIAPIYENQQTTDSYLAFSFFGTDGKVRVPKESTNGLRLLSTSLNGDNLAKAWDVLSNGDYDNLIRDCLELRIKHGLSDWAYLLMIRDLSEKYCGGRNNDASFFMSWIFCQTGYQMRLAIEGNKLYMLFGTKHQIYGIPYYNIDGEHFYPLLHEGEKMVDGVQICGASFPEEQPLSLFLPSVHSFAEVYGNERTLTSDRYQNMKVTVKVNQNLMKFYSTYPSSMINENFITRWAMYANTPMTENVRETMYPQLWSFITGKSQLEAVNMLLNWVQTGFIYEYDDKVWGGDRAFFAEESLNYPYCDCEDRSILFTRLVRDLLGLECILIHYPGHLACAVNFTDNVNGDYINLNGKRFIVTDPTYIGAPVGRTMPNMNNATATVILLN